MGIIRIAYIECDSCGVITPTDGHLGKDIQSSANRLRRDQGWVHQGALQGPERVDYCPRCAYQLRESEEDNE